MGPLGIGGTGSWVSYWPTDSTSGGLGRNMAHVPESHNSPTVLVSNYCVCLNVFVSQGRTHCAHATTNLSAGHELRQVWVKRVEGLG